MMTDAERLDREVLAKSIEWGLEPPQPGSGITDDLYLSPEAAAIVLDALIATYEWLAGWAELARKATIAEVAVEVARANDAPRLVSIALTQTADEARTKLDGSNVPNGINADQILKCFAKLQRVAARKPEGYGR